MSLRIEQPRAHQTRCLRSRSELAPQGRRAVDTSQTSRDWMQASSASQGTSAILQFDATDGREKLHSLRVMFMTVFDGLILGLGLFLRHLR